MYRCQKTKFKIAFKWVKSKDCNQKREMKQKVTIENRAHIHTHTHRQRERDRQRQRQREIVLVNFMSCLISVIVKGCWQSA